MTIVSAPAINTACATSEGQRRPSCQWAVGERLAARLLIVHPPSLESPLDQRKQQDDQEKYKGDGRGVPHVEQLEPGFINEEGKRNSRAGRTAVGHHIDLVEYL